MTDLVLPAAVEDIRTGLRAGTRPTPYLDFDVPHAVATYRRLAAALPGTAVHYAVKANPDPTLLAALAAAGCRFDVASPAEITAALMAGSSAGELVYSNPVKRREDVRFAARLGVDLFVVDSPAEVAKVADAAPGSRVLCRLVTSGEGSDWPLSRKYGCSTREAVAILREAARHGLRADGVSFHVGSQQRDPEAWGPPIAAAATVFEALRAEGLDPWLLDLGGGFPARLDDGCPPPETYAATIERHLAAAFGDRRPSTIIEPGRGIAADAGVLVSTVIGVVHRAGTRWVFLDAGVFTGLVETLEEAIRYPLSTDVGGPSGPCVLAGPTCDSADVLYQDEMVELPLALAEGDQVRFHGAGVYVATYSTVGFNGFAPLSSVVHPSTPQNSTGGALRANRADFRGDPGQAR
jgi:ornithine decarboxylase